MGAVHYETLQKNPRYLLLDNFLLNHIACTLEGVIESILIASIYNMANTSASKNESEGREELCRDLLGMDAPHTHLTQKSKVAHVIVQVTSQYLGSLGK